MQARYVPRKSLGINAAMSAPSTTSPSCPSLNELERDGRNVERHNWLNPQGVPQKAYVTSLLEGPQGPAIPTTDYIRVYPEQIRKFVPMRYTVPGTDGCGWSDTRENLRRYFEVDRYFVAQSAVAALVAEGAMRGD